VNNLLCEIIDLLVNETLKEGGLFREIILNYQGFKSFDLPGVSISGKINPNSINNTIKAEGEFTS
jgi:hypothetical protein